MTDQVQFINGYFQWLLDQAMVKPESQEHQRGVLSVMFDIPFYWVMLSDSNRAGDASVFRRYERHELDKRRHNISKDWLDRWENAAPSVLEVFIGISDRWSQFYDQPTQVFFRHLFQNMKLNIYWGTGMRPEQEQEVRDKCDKWMSRQIGRNGEGSPFPIPPGKFNIDMRITDIWGQMNAYSRVHFEC